MFSELETKLQLNQQQTAKFLGLSKSAYSMFRSGARKTPLYVIYQIDLVMMLPEAKLKKLIKSRLSWDDG